jgi:hypothetical protein
VPIVHVVPLADLIEHEAHADACVCGPRTEFVEDDDGQAVGMLVTHASLDGRELREDEG